MAAQHERTDECRHTNTHSVALLVTRSQAYSLNRGVQSDSYNGRDTNTSAWNVNKADSEDVSTGSAD